MNNKIDYLRVSVTNKCNLKCIYCHPLNDKALCKCHGLLELDEIVHIIKLFEKCGIRKVRLTGGEPLLRNDIVQLVDKVSSLDGIEDLSITTNGVLLESLAQDLKNAGLKRLNISLDSLDSDIYKTITGFDLLENVQRGINKALEVGFDPVKINCVIVKGINSTREDILPLADMSVDLPVMIRFIEYYPTTKDSKLGKEFLPNVEIRKIIEDKYGFTDDISVVKGYGPAEYFKIKKSAGTIGFISGRSSMFCNNCNRLRLSCDGKIKPCLYSAKQYDIKELLTNNTSEENILSFLRDIIQEKGCYNKHTNNLEEFSMQSIGG